MAKFYLNYASLCDHDLYCECMGTFSSEEEAIAERDRLIDIDREEYDGDDGKYDNFILKNTKPLFEWSDDFVTQQYRIQEVM